MTSQALFRISPRFFGQYQLRRPTQLVNGQTIKQDSIRSRILLKTIRSIFRKNTMLELLQQCHLDQCIDKSHLQLKLVASDGKRKFKDNDNHIIDLYRVSYRCNQDPLVMVWRDRSCKGSVHQGNTTPILD